jgi:hypothetical protein
MWPAPWVTPCVFFGWWSSPGISRGSEQLTLLLIPWGYKHPRFLQSFLQFLHWGLPSSDKGLAANIQLYLCQALAELLRRQPYQGFHQQAPPDIHNSVQVWCLYVGWIPRWSSLWMAFPLVFALSISPSLGFFLYIVGFSASMASWHLVLMGLFSLYSPSCNKLKCLQALPPVLKGVECVSS